MLKKSEKVFVLRRHKYYVRLEDGALCRVLNILKFVVSYNVLAAGTTWSCSRGSFHQKFRVATTKESRPFSKQRRQTLVAKLVELG